MLSRNVFAISACCQGMQERTLAPGSLTLSPGIMRTSSRDPLQAGRSQQSPRPPRPGAEGCGLSGDGVQEQPP